MKVWPPRHDRRDPWLPTGPVNAITPPSAGEPGQQRPWLRIKSIPGFPSW